MADSEVNTTDAQIADPNNPDVQIDNPDYVQPEPAVAAAKPLDLDEPPVADAVVVGKTGNSQIDAVGQLLADKQVKNADKMIAEFAENGELSLAAQAELVETLGEQLASMAINQLTTEATKLREANTKARDEVLDYAMNAFGETDKDATWEAIQKFVKQPDSGFSAADRAELTKMIGKGGLSARLAIDNIKAVYDGNPNTTHQADLLQGDTMTSTNFKPISAQAYAEEVKTLASKYGYESLEVKQLQQRRAQSRNAGIA